MFFFNGRFTKVILSVVIFVSLYCFMYLYDLMVCVSPSTWYINAYTVIFSNMVMSFCLVIFVELIEFFFLTKNSIFAIMPVFFAMVLFVFFK